MGLDVATEHPFIAFYDTQEAVHLANSILTSACYDRQRSQRPDVVNFENRKPRTFIIPNSGKILLRATIIGLLGQKYCIILAELGFSRNQILYFCQNPYFIFLTNP